MNTETGMPILKSVTATRDNLKVEAAKEKTAEVGQIEQPEAKPLDANEVNAVVTKLNSMAQNMHRELQFSVDEKSGDTIIKVLDKETDEVIREIPSKEMREVKARLQETVGVIFKDSV
jgi:flagellar protein FlaG